VAPGLWLRYDPRPITKGVTSKNEAQLAKICYDVIAPALLMDLFPRQARARVLSAFYLAAPLGSALGIGLGGTLAVRLSWHDAFFVVGVPSLLAAFAALALPDPVRGTSEGVDLEVLKAREARGATKSDYRDLLAMSSYHYAVFGMAANTFATGGLLVWVPLFLASTRMIDQERAGWLAQNWRSSHEPPSGIGGRLT
jgi:MFS family permease